MSFFNLEVLNGKPTKFLRILPHLKLSKNKKQTKFASHKTILKSLIIKWLRFSNKRFFM
jgi:hypothetical protein